MTNNTALIEFFTALGAATILGAIAAVVLPLVGVVELIRGHTWPGVACIAVGIVAALCVAKFLGFI